MYERGARVRYFISLHLHIHANLNRKFFTCGSGKASQGIKETLIDIIHEGVIAKTGQEISKEEAAVRFETITSGRYATDVFD